MTRQNLLKYEVNYSLYLLNLSNTFYPFCPLLTTLLSPTGIIYYQFAPVLDQNRLPLLWTGVRPVNRKIEKYVHMHIQAFTSLNKKQALTVLILSNGEVIRYHKLIPVVAIRSVRCLNTGSEDRLTLLWYCRKY